MDAAIPEPIARIYALKAGLQQLEAVVPGTDDWDPAADHWDANTWELDFPDR